jgi:hypothetical protein
MRATRKNNQSSQGHFSPMLARSFPEELERVYLCPRKSLHFRNNERSGDGTRKQQWHHTQKDTQEAASSD